MLVTMRHFDGATIAVKFPQLAEAVGRIDVAVTALDQTLEDLNTSLRTKLVDWDGGAYGTFEQTKTQWMTAAGNIKTLLTSIRDAVLQSNEMMMMREQYNVEMLRR